MRNLSVRLGLLALGAAPFAFALQSPPAAQGPMSEAVFKNIKSFKGVPAGELIPAMEFMSAALKYECSDCHDPKDFSAETRAKETARRMIDMQRGINAQHFGGRPLITCMSCHRGAEHPVSAAIPEGAVLRHARMENPPKPEDLMARHKLAAGSSTAPIVRTGTLTAPNDQSHKVETLPAEMVQTDGGKFRLVSGDRKVGSDGAQTWYGTRAMFSEPAAIFARLGRAWRGDEAFSGLERPTIAGTEKLNGADTVVVRGSRPSTQSTEELYFDAKTGLLARLLNIRRTDLGTMVTTIDYSNYRNLKGVKTPMKVVMTFAGDEKWVLDFRNAKADSSITESVFKLGG